MCSEDSRVSNRFPGKSWSGRFRKKIPVRNFKAGKIRMVKKYRDLGQNGSSVIWPIQTNRMSFGFRSSWKVFWKVEKAVFVEKTFLSEKLSRMNSPILIFVLISVCQIFGRANGKTRYFYFFIFVEAKIFGHLLLLDWRCHRLTNSLLPLFRLPTEDFQYRL